MNKNLINVKKLMELAFSVKEISHILNISQSYVYKLQTIIYDDLVKDDLRNDFKNAISNNELVSFLESLSFKKLCCLSRMYYTYGKSRIEKINHCLERFSMWNKLGLYPENISKDAIKRAYFKSSKKTHPDLTKRDTSREFIELNVIYQDLIKNFQNYKYYGY